MSTHKESEWYKSLEPEGRFVADLIIKYHNYFKDKDRKYKRIVYCTKIAILLFCISSA